MPEDHSKRTEAESYLVDAFQRVAPRFEVAKSIDEITVLVRDALGGYAALREKFGSAEEFKEARATTWQTLFSMFAPRKNEERFGRKSFARTFPRLKLESAFIDRSVGGLCDMDVSPQEDLGMQLVDRASAHVLWDVLNALGAEAFPPREKVKGE